MTWRKFLGNNMNTEDIKRHVSITDIEVLKLRSHSKASEEYVDVAFNYPRLRKKICTSIPYQYRRCGLFLDSPADIAGMIERAYKAMEKSTRENWVKKEKRFWDKENLGKTVTKPFFDKLINLGWNCIACDFPKNPNWARRIQDIKEMGYLMATDTKRYCKKCKKNTTHIILVPLERGARTGYEVINMSYKNEIIKHLDSVNSYENKKAPSANSLIPDHKFPEIRWDAETRHAIIEDMDEKTIRKKFQLLDNQRNLQKREICRTCFQTGKRGKIFGINYYYEGTEDWPKEAPKTGKAAEKGCIGCPWYDIQEWRNSLNKKLS